MNYALPVSLEIGGRVYQIRSDYRAVLDVCAALTDIDLNDNEKVYVSLSIFYPEVSEIPPENIPEALERCFWFINCGTEDNENKPSVKLMDWEQDFQYIVAPINRVMGQEIRSLEYLHWWSFISFYREIGDCLFAQIVRIRDLKRRGKKLDKQDREWYNQNRDLVDLKTTYSEAEKQLMESWGI